ncbi:hypothetical protein EJB05_40313 [Eragrostis curvula]|uniref:RING-CH-type domain-containing protein n=1 Tax=Eragrostis curvula TaxID=38414 RepID=A0A5J9TZH7_9POAL|nr:hypothetical protein EJB05_40313 [Eragrostis curvula]
MGLKEQHVQVDITQQDDAVKSPSSDDHHKPRVSDCSTDKDSSLPLCRVCHCVEPDFRGESALGFLGILPPSREPCAPRTDNAAAAKTSTSKDDITSLKDAPRFVEFVSPQGEIFVCPTDVEPGPLHQQDHLMDLGCSCKNELALAHYACALKWFISHGSTVCEICGNVAANVRPSDFNKVLASLKDYEALRERTYTGELPYLQYEADTAVDPDAVAAIRRQRLSEISSWFNPHNSHLGVSQGHIQHPALSPSNNSVVEHSVVAATALHTSRSLERSGVFVAMGLAVIVLAWFVAPHVGKKVAIIGLHMLLGGLCALTIIISLRFVSFPKNPVWFYAILGNRICILVPCLWRLGFTNSQHTLLMSIESIFTCDKVGFCFTSAGLGIASLCIFTVCHISLFSVFFDSICICLTQEKMIKLYYWV